MAAIKTNDFTDRSASDNLWTTKNKNKKQASAQQAPRIRRRTAMTGVETILYGVDNLAALRLFFADSDFHQIHQGKPEWRNSKAVGYHPLADAGEE
jgi:hypothetical protein